MTTEEIIDYYAQLLILQYIGKNKAYATIKTLVKTVVMDQLPISVQDAFNIDTATGVQLDVLAKYAAVSRTGYGLMGPITLDDDDFRSLIKLGIIVNNSGSSLSIIQDLLNTYFPGQIFVFDYANMRLSYYIDSDVGSQDLAEMFVYQGLLPKPMGVQLSVVVYWPVLDNFFGFCTYDDETPANHGFNTYDDYDMDCPWISNSNIIYAP